MTIVTSQTSQSSASLYCIKTAARQSPARTAKTLPVSLRRKQRSVRNDASVGVRINAAGGRTLKRENPRKRAARKRKGGESKSVGDLVGDERYGARIISIDGERWMVRQVEWDHVGDVGVELAHRYAMNFKPCDDCEACKSRTCVQRIVVDADGDGHIVHDQAGELS